MVLASLAIVLALVTAYARQAAVNSDQFANRATAALRDDSVRSLIAEKITDEVVLKRRGRSHRGPPDHPVGDRRDRREQCLRAACSGWPFATCTVPSSTGIRTASRSPWPTRGRWSPAALEQLSPGLAKKVEATGRVELVNQNLGSLGSKLVRIADRDPEFSPCLTLVLTLALAAGAIWISADPRQTVVELGIGIAAAGVVVLGRLRGRALGRDRPCGWARGPGCRGRGLGRIPWRPANGGVDPSPALER